MKGQKSLINKLVKSTFLASAIAFSSLLSTDTANAQSPGELRAYGDAFRSFSRIQRSGLLPANSINDLRFQAGTAIFMDFLSDTAYSSAQSKDFQMLRQTIRNNPQLYRQYQQASQVDVDHITQTYIANYRKDFNRDGAIGIREFVGLNKSEYNSDEKLILGLYMPIPGILGKKGEMKVFNTRGEKIFEHGKFFDKNYGINESYLNLDVVLEKYGAGTYSVGYYFDGKHWENREFNLIGKKKIVHNSEKPSINFNKLKSKGINLTKTPVNKPIKNSSKNLEIKKSKEIKFE